jgi:hypothetical protein
LKNYKSRLYNFLNSFPYFLDKRTDSNFHKTSKVINNEFLDVFQQLKNIYNGYHLDKNLLLWREQKEDYYYDMYFLAKYPLLKSVKVTRIYLNKEYEEVKEILFDKKYDYNSDSEIKFYETWNNKEEKEKTNVIPLDKFIMEVETWDEYKYTKGYPENDEKKINLFDHDETLDILGNLVGIPRKTYSLVDEWFYKETDPPYNNKTTEDDYYYLNRIFYYTSHLHNTPLPCLTLWKYYGIESELKNMEEFLCKMNRDYMCTPKEDLNLFLFVFVTTRKVRVGKKVYFTIIIMDEYGNLINDYVNVYVDNLNVKSVKDMYLFSSDTVGEFEIYFEYEGIESEVFNIIVTETMEAHWYVSTEGSDTNDGKTIPTAFATLERAMKAVNDGESVAVLEGDYVIDEVPLVRASCSIYSYTLDIPVFKTENNIVLEINQNKILNIDNIGFKKNILLRTNDDFFMNNNKTKRKISIPFSQLSSYYFSIDNRGHLILHKTDKSYAYTVDKNSINEITDWNDIMYEIKNGNLFTNQNDVKIENEKVIRSLYNAT